MIPRPRNKNSTRVSSLRTSVTKVSNTNVVTPTLATLSRRYPDEPSPRQLCQHAQLSSPSSREPQMVSAINDESSDGIKYRQLPCKTFLSVGSCPYRDRCVYLHDPRLIYRDTKTKTRKRNQEDLGLDRCIMIVPTI